jgi:hypothetical protein
MNILLNARLSIHQRCTMGRYKRCTMGRYKRPFQKAKDPIILDNQEPYLYVPWTDSNDPESKNNDSQSLSPKVVTPSPDVKNPQP